MSKLKFPTHLRKMWSGSAVQAWIDEQLAEQAEQEPVGEMIDKAGYKGVAWYLEPPETCTKLYAAPVRTKDLTDEELWEAAKTAKSNDLTDAFRAVIARFKEINNL